MIESIHVVEFSDLLDHADAIDLFPGRYNYVFVQNFIFHPEILDPSLTGEQIISRRRDHQCWLLELFRIHRNSFDDRLLDDRCEWEEPLKRLVLSYMDKHKIDEMVVVMGKSHSLLPEIDVTELEPVPEDYERQPTVKCQI